MYEAYLSDSNGNNSVGDAQRSEVSKQVALLLGLVARITLKSGSDDTEFFIDDALVGKGTVANYPVSRGVRRLSARATHRWAPPWVRVLHVEGQEALSARVRFPEVPY